MTLSAHDLIQIWEVGVRQHPLDRALTILAVADPVTARETHATFSMGQRDTRLLNVWEQTFGPRLDGYVECPNCRERLEFGLDTAQLRAEPGPATQDHTLHLEDFALRFRPPNSRDLAAAVACVYPDAARRLLVRRCVLQADRAGAVIDGDDLPEPVVAALAARMAECDPQAEVLLSLTCPACGCGWQALFDIVTFLWAELAARARRLLREVHQLAMAYGWREANILALSDARRQFYLEMVM